MVIGLSCRPEQDVHNVSSANKSLFRMNSIFRDSTLSLSYNKSGGIHDIQYISPFNNPHKSAMSLKIIEGTPMQAFPYELQKSNSSFKDITKQLPFWASPSKII
jgi:hypothetical protein